jgi:hypothetical protein
MAGGRLPGSTGNSDYAVAIDDGTLCLAATPAPGPLRDRTPPTREESPATRAGQEISIALGADMTWDSVVRQIYIASAKAIQEQAEQMVRSGAMSPAEASTWANGQRNALIRATRDRSTPLGKAIAEAIKPSNKLKTVEGLERAGKTAEGIIESAGRSNLWVNRVAVGFRYAGPTLLVIGVGFSAYNVVTAPEGERWHVAAKESGAWGGSLAGAWAFGEAGCAAGALAGAPFAGVGAGPGCAVGAVVGIIGGAWFGGWVGENTADYVYRSVEGGAQ